MWGPHGLGKKTRSARGGAGKGQGARGKGAHQKEEGQKEGALNLTDVDARARGGPTVKRCVYPCVERNGTARPRVTVREAQAVRARVVGVVPEHAVLDVVERVREPADVVSDPGIEARNPLTVPGAARISQRDGEF